MPLLPHVLSWNVRSLEQRLPSLLLLLRFCDVVALQEVWSPGPETVARLKGEGFDVHLCLRAERRGGGVAVLVRRAVFSSALVELPPFRDIEAVAVRCVDPRTGKAFVVASVYVVPNALPDGVLPALERLRLAADFFVGDFNAHWPQWDPAGRANGIGEQVVAFLRRHADVELLNRVPRATHVDGGGLDLAFARRTEDFSLELAIEVGATAMGSDHYPVWIGMATSRKLPRLVTSQIGWGGVTNHHWTAFEQILGKCHLRDRGSADERLAAICGCVLKALSSFPRGGGTRQVSWPKSLLDMAAAAAAARQRATTDAEWGAVREAEAKLAAAAKSHFERTEFTEAMAATTPGALWRLWKRGEVHEKCSSLKAGDRICETDRSQARAFLDIFAAKHRAHGPGPPTQWVFSASASPPSPFTMAELQEALTRQRHSGAGGIDGVPAQVIPYFTQNVLTALLALANRCLAEGTVPASWLCGEVVPVPKEGKDHKVPEGYRPVTLTSVLSRVVERLFVRRMMASLSFDPHQYGFLPHRCVEMPISHVLHAASETIRSQCRCRNASTTTDSRSVRHGRMLLLGVDFSDAYCSLSPQAIAQALAAHHVAPEYVRFVMSFCTRRRMRVRQGTATSEWRQLECGVPQGSIMGPLCWNAVVDSLLQQLHAELPRYCAGRSVHADFAAYADDVLLFVGGLDPTGLRSVLQLVCNRVLDPWAKLNGIAISRKTSVMVVGGDPSADTDLLVPFTVPWGVMKPTMDEHRVLGVFLDRDLNFEPHVNHVLDSVLPLMERLKRFARVMSPPQLQVLYCGAIRSRLLFGAGAWYPHIAAKTGDRLETVHRLAARIITGVARSAQNDDALAEANLYPLSTYVAHASFLLGGRILRCRALPVAQSLAIVGVESRCFTNNLRTNAVRPCFATKALSEMRAETMCRQPLRPLDTVAITHLRPVIDLVLPPPGASDAVRKTFCEATVARWPSDVIIFTDGAVQGPASAGAFCFRWGAVTEQGSESAGCFASSFTAEMVGLTAGLKVLLRRLLDAPAVHPTVFVGTDGASVLTALQRGPEVASAVFPLWTLLGSVLPRCAALVLGYIPAHCGYADHDRVDALAREKVCANESVEVTLQDEVRHHVSRVQAAATAGARERTSFRVELAKDTTWLLPPVRLNRQGLRLLAQMRTGVVHRLGGWRHDAPEPCPHCHLPDVLARGGAAVRHMFSCTALPWPARRAALKVKDCTALIKAPAAAVAYALEFLGAMQQEEEEKEEDG